MDTPTMLEMAVIATQATFMKYASAEGKDAKMSKAEFQAMVKEELPYLDGSVDVDKLFTDLDSDKSDALDFNEFASMVFTIAASSYDLLQELMKKKGDKVKV